MTDDALERAFRDACFGEDAEAELSSDYPAFLRARGVPPNDVDAMATAPQRLSVYRRLVRNTLEGVVFRLLPYTRARMGEAFDRSFARFLEEQGPRTHYLRDVPAEFLAWAGPRWQKDEIAGPKTRWLIDLARHELVSFLVSAAPKLAEPRATDVAIDRPLLLSSLARIERYAFAVHELAADEADQSPSERAVTLLYHRDAAFELRTMELTPLAATLLEKGPVLPLREAIAAACEAAGEAMTDETLVVIAKLLADLAERGVLLGAQDPENARA